MASILVLNGPNLNLLGQRQPEIYGKTTLADVEKSVSKLAREMGHTVAFQQSNYEGALVDAIQGASESFDGIILNAAAYTHTSIALMDAIKATGIPVIELHLSNIHAREEFRHQSYIAQAAIGMICGFGAGGYALALRAMASHLEAADDA